MLYIILPVHNRVLTTKKFVRMLVRQTFQDYHLILVDDGCVDETVLEVKKIVPAKQLTVLHGDGNLWWGGGLHAGYLHLKAQMKEQKLEPDDLVLLSNDDNIFADDYLENFVTCFLDLQKRKLLATPVFKNLYTKKYEQPGSSYDFSKGKFISKEGLALNCLATRSLLLYADEFLTLGGFHPLLIPHYLSDYEFTLRAFVKGYELRVLEELELIYDPETTGNRNINTSSVRQRFNTLFFKGSPDYVLARLYVQFVFSKGIGRLYVPLRQFLGKLLWVFYPGFFSFYRKEKNSK